VEDRRTILITGAAGNLGSLLSRQLVPTGHELRLMYHRKPLPDDVAHAANVRPARADLGDPATLTSAVAGADVIVHFAGRLFAPDPERFLPETNTRWFSNLLTAALHAQVGRVILISFPHVEGPTSVAQPATGRLDRQPRRLLCVWREPTLYQLLSTADYLRAVDAAIFKPGVRGIYHVGDERAVTLQKFLDEACRVWGYRRPVRIPFAMIYTAAWLCECFARIARTQSPLTRDFVRLGRVSHWGDTSRARMELIPQLLYPTFETGLTTL
jgi:nucleoside-diphosphate-sugar epimerase